MNIKGTVDVTLDAVAIEQAMLNNGGTTGSVGRIFIIMAAAYEHEDIKSLKLFLDRTNHALVYTNMMEHNENQNISVRFEIRPLTHHEIIAREAGL